MPTSKPTTSIVPPKINNLSSYFHSEFNAKKRENDVYDDSDANFSGTVLIQDHDSLNHFLRQNVLQTYRIWYLLATSSWLQKVIEYCIKVRKTCPAGKESNNSGMFWRKIAINDAPGVCREWGSVSPGPTNWWASCQYWQLWLSWEHVCVLCISNVMSMFLFFFLYCSYSSVKSGLPWVLLHLLHHRHNNSNQLVTASVGSFRVNFIFSAYECHYACCSQCQTLDCHLL